MGLLSQGRPLNWDETKRYAKFVQERGIAQFINIYNRSKDRADAPFKWGDEVEYIIVKYDHQDRRARVSLKAEKVFRKIAKQGKNDTGPAKSLWNPEFASYMVEGTPGLPYGGDGLMITSLCEIEGSMKYRRDQVQSTLEQDETVLTITSFPRLGCPDFTYPICKVKPETSASGSIFFPDEAIYQGHPRFETLVRNIRSRRRRKVIINLPIYRDIYTPDPFYECFTDLEARKASRLNHVYMDAMGFGMGCCCLQITMQATHLEEAKVLYDQLAPLTPIALALSAASPIYRGYLTDRDCRWEVISCSVDDRTREESGETRELKESQRRIPKSRYDSISCYLSRHGQKYNDIPLVIDENYYELMIANNVDHAVARHIAHLFIRDPITLYREKLEQSDQELDHFENIQSTNWQTMRFKPPPAVDSPIGWRVEFRPLEAQTTDFENAAFVVFITLLSRVILAYKLNFLMPLSLVDANMIEAQKRDAIRDSKFWFRTDITHRSCKEPLSTVLENCSNNTNSTLPRDNQQSMATSVATAPALAAQLTPTTNNIYSSRSRSRSALSHNHQDHLRNTTNRPASNESDTNKSTVSDLEGCCKQMTIDEIINGREGFVGVLPIVWHYVESLDDGINSDSIMKIKRYLRLVSDRASLKVKTTARMMRDFIDSHPRYAHDSVVNDEVAYDLLQKMDKIGRSGMVCPELTGELGQPLSNLSFSATTGQFYGNSATNSRDDNMDTHEQSVSNNNRQSLSVKSTTMCNNFSLSRRLPLGKALKQSSDKHSEHHGNRSMSR
uniref:Glutamate--cysteine ligase n=1 Tax=Aceria tosichella TaxID=561515 RepID=A0A6G1S840_9ACAR